MMISLNAANDVIYGDGGNSESPHHIQANKHMIVAYFTIERKSLPCKAYGIRLTEAVEGRRVVLGIKSNDLQPATNVQEWRLAA